MTAPTIRVISGEGSHDGAALVAAGIPAEPPREWFDFRDFPDGTPLTFTTDGQVYGKLAARDISHVGMPGQRVRAPFSSTNYAYFHTGQVRCADGSTVNTGPITMGGGHASVDPTVTADAAKSHYDDVSQAVGDIVAFDRPDGVYCAGAARPGLTPSQLRTAMASPPSGDWRPIEADGKWLRDPEAIAFHLVSTPGFITRRDLALAASANLPDSESYALVASAGLMPRIVISTSTPPEEATPMTAQPETTDTTASEPVTAAAPPFAKGEPAPGSQLAEDSLVQLTADPPPGVVRSIDGDTAVVEIEVPVSSLAAAEDGAKKAMAASAQRRMERREYERDKAATSEEIGGLRNELATLTASLRHRDDQAAFEKAPAGLTGE